MQNLHYCNCILKARQMGFTTFIVIYMLDNCLFSDNVSTGVIADTSKNAESIFNRKVRYAYDNLPKAIKSLCPLTVERTSSLKFANGSSIDVSTSFRSGTLNILHVSEYGKISNEFPRKAIEIKTGALEAVGRNQMIFIESTAEGSKGEYYDLCQDSMKNKDDKLESFQFKFHFFPWYDDPAYVADRCVVEITKDDIIYFEELFLITKHVFTKEQINWYLNKKSRLKDMMFREYPSTSQEAFWSVIGKPVFDKTGMKFLFQNTQVPLFIARIGKDRKITIDSTGGLKVFKKPIVGFNYTIGADVAEGLRSGDYSTADVLDHNGDQVAQFTGHLFPDDFAHVLLVLGNYYNNALVAVERNNHGILTNTILRDEKYTNIYTDRDIERRYEGKDNTKIGWLTTARTKPKIIDQLNAAIKNQEVVIRCKETIDELRTYVYENEGRGMGAMNGCHDDRVMSFAIAYEAYRSRPERKMSVKGFSPIHKISSISTFNRPKKRTAIAGW